MQQKAQMRISTSLIYPFIYQAHCPAGASHQQRCLFDWHAAFIHAVLWMQDSFKVLDWVNLILLLEGGFNSLSLVHRRITLLFSWGFLSILKNVCSKTQAHWPFVMSERGTYTSTCPPNWEFLHGGRLPEAVMNLDSLLVRASCFTGVCVWLLLTCCICALTSRSSCPHRHSISRPTCSGLRWTGIRGLFTCSSTGHTNTPSPLPHVTLQHDNERKHNEIKP